MRFEDHVGSLLHGGVLSDRAEQIRQKSFIALQLAMSFAACAVAPFYLAFHGVPVLWQTLAFSFAMLPLAGAALVWRTGDFAVAQALSIVSLVGLAAAFALGGGSAYQIALTLLVLAPLPSVLTGDKRFILAGGGCAVLTTLGIAAMSGVAALFATAFIVAAIVFSTAVALKTVQIDALQTRSAKLNASRYQAISDVIGDVVICFDRSGAVEFISADCDKRLGLTRHDLIGRGFFEHIHVGDRPRFLKAVADATHASERMSVTVRLRRDDAFNEDYQAALPYFLWIEISLRPFDAEGCETLSDSSLVAILRDVTKAKLAENELEASRAAAARVSHSRDQFLANMSHELRTPLNAIIGFSEMLSNADLAPREPAKQQEYADIIRQSGQHLLSVVNTILDMSKLQSGSFTLTPDTFDIAPMIDLCCDMVKLKANEGQVELIRAYSNHVSEIVGDRQACQQIIINLLSNAVKFTPPQGRVTINVRSEGNASLIQISDTGIGIAPRDLEQIGDPFFQASGSYNRAYEGTGLGLSIVRGLVGLHGGTISIESELGKGTSITVRLPRDYRETAGKPKGAAEITTIPRRTRPDDMRTFSNEMMVKKIA